MKENIEKIQNLLEEVGVLLVDCYNKVDKTKQPNDEKTLIMQIKRINLMKTQLNTIYF